MTAVIAKKKVPLLKARKKTNPTAPAKASALSSAWCSPREGGSSPSLCAAPAAPTPPWKPALLVRGGSTRRRGPESDRPPRHRTRGRPSAAETPPLCIHGNGGRCGLLERKKKSQKKTDDDIRSEVMFWSRFLQSLHPLPVYEDFLTHGGSLVETEKSWKEWISWNGLDYAVNFRAFASEGDPVEKDLLHHLPSTHHSPLLHLH